MSSLFRQNISHTPIVCSHGRPHEDTLTISRCLSESIARIRDFVSARLSVKNSTPASPHLEIWRRSVRQILAAFLDSVDLEFSFWSLSRWCLRFPQLVLCRGARLCSLSAGFNARLMHPWRTWSDMGCSPSWNPLRCSWRLSLLWNGRSVARLRPRSRSRSMFSVVRHELPRNTAAWLVGPVLLSLAPLQCGTQTASKRRSSGATEARRRKRSVWRETFVFCGPAVIIR